MQDVQIGILHGLLSASHKSNFHSPRIKLPKWKLEIRERKQGLNNSCSSFDSTGMDSVYYELCLLNMAHLHVKTWLTAYRSQCGLLGIR